MIKKDFFFRKMFIVADLVSLMHTRLEFGPYITSKASKPKAHNAITLHYAPKPETHNAIT